MDTQIWYAIFSTIFGGIYGAFRCLGEVSAPICTSYLMFSSFVSRNGICSHIICSCYMIELDCTLFCFLLQKCIF